MTTHPQPPLPSNLHGRHRHTYEAIFRSPTSHNLEWHDVQSLLAVVAEVKEAENGAIHATCRGHSLLLHAPKHKDLASVEDVLAIRRFLVESAEPPPAAPAAPGARLLVVVDHREAKIYRTEEPGAEAERLVPYDPHGYGRHLHSAHEWTDGKRVPERKSYYEAIAKTLRGAGQVLLFGSGTGRSSAMEQLQADLQEHHHDVAATIVGAVVIDAHHTSDGQLLAKAREFYAARDDHSKSARNAH